jgi:hypothetical protein
LVKTSGALVLAWRFTPRTQDLVQGAKTVTNIMEERSQLLALLDCGAITREGFRRRIRAALCRWKKENASAEHKKSESAE